MNTESRDLETETRLNEILGLSDFEVDSEEKAQEYMNFMQTKMDELMTIQTTQARAEAERFESEMSKQPRKVRRMFLKKGTKFSDRFSSNGTISK